MPIKQCDALVVGGGPAGSTIAWKLSNAGLNVTVIDKQPFPRDKVCAGWITPAVIDSLQIDIKDYCKDRVFQPITGFRTGRIGGQYTDTSYDQPVSYGIRRREFDQYLLERSGANLKLGEAVKTIDRNNGHFLINGAIETPLLIGAGGHFCPVARFLGAKLGSNELVVAAQEIEFEMTPAQTAACRVLPEKPELYFCKDLKGYAWVFRKGGHLNIGLGREDNHQLTQHIEQFVLFLEENGRIPEDIPEKFHGHAYLLYGHSPRKSIDDNVMLIGDSMGLAYPQSGEGIRPAIESAMIAAEVALQASGDYKKEKLSPYIERIQQRFGEFATSKTSVNWLPDSIRYYLGGKLVSTQWFAQHVVIDRWFLHAHEPPLSWQSQGDTQSISLHKT